MASLGKPHRFAWPSDIANALGHRAAPFVSFGGGGWDPINVWGVFFWGNIVFAGYLGLGLCVLYLVVQLIKVHKGHRPLMIRPIDYNSIRCENWVKERLLYVSVCMCNTVSTSIEIGDQHTKKNLKSGNQYYLKFPNTLCTLRAPKQLPQTYSKPQFFTRRSPPRWALGSWFSST